MANKKRDYSYTNADDPTIIKEEILMPSTIETIDTALFEYFEEKLNILRLQTKAGTRCQSYGFRQKGLFKLKTRET